VILSTCSNLLATTTATPIQTSGLRYLLRALESKWKVTRLKLSFVIIVSNSMLLILLELIYVDPA